MRALVSGAMWRFAAASTVGVSHVRDDLPCQDAHQCKLVPSLGGQILIVVVSDGAGSAAESAQGAAYICGELIVQIEKVLPTVSDPASFDWLRDSVVRTRDGLIAKADHLGLPPRELAATLLCAVLAPGWSAFAQVGDGAIVTPEAGTETWSWLFWPERGEYANTTSFLTDPAALDKLQIDTLSQAQYEIAIFTDGLQHLVLKYEDQTVHSPYFERMMGSVRNSSVNGEDEALSFDLAKYLSSAPVSSRADDDLTLVLASRVATGSNVAATS